MLDKAERAIEGSIGSIRTGRNSAAASLGHILFFGHILYFSAITLDVGPRPTFFHGGLGNFADNLQAW
jgi:hypothetical protein